MFEGMVVSRTGDGDYVKPVLILHRKIAHVYVGSLHHLAPLCIVHRIEWILMVAFSGLYLNKDYHELFFGNDVDLDMVAAFPFPLADGVTLFEKMLHRYLFGNLAPLAVGFSVLSAVMVHWQCVSMP